MRRSAALAQRLARLEADLVRERRAHRDSRQRLNEANERAAQAVDESKVWTLRLPDRRSYEFRNELDAINAARRLQGQGYEVRIYDATGDVSWSTRTRGGLAAMPPHRFTEAE